MAGFGELVGALGGDPRPVPSPSVYEVAKAGVTIIGINGWIWGGGGLLRGETKSDFSMNRYNSTTIVKASARHPHSSAHCTLYAHPLRRRHYSANYGLTNPPHCPPHYPPHYAPHYPRHYSPQCPPHCPPHQYDHPRYHAYYTPHDSSQPHRRHDSTNRGRQPTSAPPRAAPRGGAAAPPTDRGLHSSTSRLNASTFCGMRWVPALDRRVMTRHKQKMKRLTDQNGLG